MNSSILPQRNCYTWAKKIKLMYKFKLDLYSPKACSEFTHKANSQIISQFSTGSSHDGTEPIPSRSRPEKPRSLMRDLATSSKEMERMLPRCEVLIIGGGIIGSAVAYWVSEVFRRRFPVYVVERDPLYTRASSMLSSGGIRHQFSMKENIQLSLFSSNFLVNVKDHLSVLHESPADIQFNHQGYLFLHPPRDVEQAKENVKLQRNLGAKVDLFSKSHLAEKYPWLNLEGIECGTMGLDGEGWFDPWSLLRALKQRNIFNGVRYIHGEVRELIYDDRFTDEEIMSGKDVHLKSALIRYNDGDEIEVGFAEVVNCGGAWAADVAEMAMIGLGTGPMAAPLPVEPRKRFVYVTQCPDGPVFDCPFVVDASGVYCRREGYGGHYVCGANPVTEEDEPDIGNLEVDYDFYHDNVLPKLAKRIPAFKDAKLKCGWAGYYDYNPIDQNLIVGRHPQVENFIFANGLGGHGLQHAMGIGQAISQLIFEKEYTDIDLTALAFDRFLLDRHVHESLII